MNAASAMVRGAELLTRRPIPELTPYLGCFWWIDVADGTCVRTFPDACTSISIIISRSATPECFFIGPRLAPAERMPSIGHSLFGVRLKPGVGYLFAAVPMYSFVGARRLLTEVIPEDGSRFGQRLSSARSADDHFDALEDLLLTRLSGRALHPCVEKALALIEESGGQVRIAELARQCRLSARRLTHLLSTWVGLPPKTLARVTRFQRFLEQMETAPSETSASRAVDLGYFDQAHLTREVAEFCGATPGRLSPRHVADFSKTRCE